MPAVGAQSQGANKRRLDASSTPRPTNAAGKRSRVSRACDQCRTAREKCDGQPVCSTCAASKRACTYTANPKKRGIQPGYIRTLELALTWLFNNSDVESILNKKLSQEGASSVLLERDTKESNKLHKSWRRSKFCRDVDKLLSGEDIAEEDSRFPDTDDQDSETEEPLRQGTAAPSFVGHPSVEREFVQAYTQDYPRADRMRDGQLTHLPPDRWRLFDNYFAYTHCWFPISEKHDILKLSYSYPEGGLHLSPSMIASGDHAELWSILALASLQDTSSERDTPVPLDRSNAFTPGRIYDIARTLIPNEYGAFELGHVKALLLLALFNITQSCPDAAWLLVGHASRIVIDLEQKTSSPVARFKHVFSGCFFLDHLLSIQLERQPYLHSSDIERVGKIHEDGLEEWQPWTGSSDAMSMGSRSRAPALSLSTFNHLIDLAGIMGVARSQRNSPQEAVARLEAWRRALPPTFEHVLSDRSSLPSAPPALLIQAVYHCCCMATFSSQSWLQRMLDVLEQSQNNMGWYALPPIVSCLLDICRNHIASSATMEGLNNRLQYFRVELNRAWRQKSKPSREAHQHSPVVERRTHTAEPSNAPSSRAFASHQQIHTPESIQHPVNHHRTSSSVMDDVIPDLSPALLDHASQSMGFDNIPHLQDFHAAPFDHSFAPVMADQWNTTGSGSRNVESFFDELASLDGAERVENQPQFMQNLGFAPDANIADLLTSDFGQLTSILPPYVQQGYQEGTQLNGAQFFDGG